MYKFWLDDSAKHKTKSAVGTRSLQQKDKTITPPSPIRVVKFCGNIEKLYWVTYDRHQSMSVTGSKIILKSF